MFFDEKKKDTRRTLSLRDKQILYRNAQGRCQNPACNKKIDFDEMQVGHKTAWSKGGRTTLKNSLCLCYRCNKLQGTDSWETFLKKQNIIDPKEELKKALNSLNIQQLKYLAKMHDIKIKRIKVENYFDFYYKAPSKIQYIKELLKVVTLKEIKSVPETIPTKSTKPKKKKSDEWWL